MLLKPSGIKHRSAGIGIQPPHFLEHHARLSLHGLLEDGGQRGAAVLDIQVDVTGLNRAVADECAAKIQPAIHGQRRHSARWPAP